MPLLKPVAKRSHSRQYINLDEGKSFGIQVRMFRKERKMTLQELAYRSDVEISTIFRVEKAQMIITLDLVFSIAKALDVPPHKLLEF